MPDQTTPDEARRLINKQAIIGGHVLGQWRTYLSGSANSCVICGATVFIAEAVVVNGTLISLSDRTLLVQSCTGCVHA